MGFACFFGYGNFTYFMRVVSAVLHKFFRRINTETASYIKYLESSIRILTEGVTYLPTNFGHILHICRCFRAAS